MNDAVHLTGEIASVLTFQQYPPAPAIDGVSLTPLRKHRADNGSFMELARLSSGQVEGVPGGFDLRQASVSVAAPGRVNAFHVHPRLPQNELWCVIDGLLSVWLVDCREASPTSGARRRVVLCGEEPAFLRIPAGVAHGYRAGPRGATLVYLMDQQFDASNPNEGRLPWDHFGAELWEDDRG